MRNFLVILASTGLTALIVLVFMFKTSDKQGDFYINLGGINGIGNFTKQAAVFLSGESNTLYDYMKRADGYLEEARGLKEYKDRYILIDKISKYRHNLEGALRGLENSEKNNTENMRFMARATARHLFFWAPFYHYLHPEAQSALIPVIKKLEKEHRSILSKLASIEPNIAGEIATEDLEYYIEDIRKSAARKNSDFIRFSYEDYLAYREFFDELAQSYPDFSLGFAVSAYVLFDDLYAMRGEVDHRYSDKTRGYIQDMHSELRGTHAKALSRLRKGEEGLASAALEKTILAIESEMKKYPNWREDIHAIMENDYKFYKTLMATDIL